MAVDPNGLQGLFGSDNIMDASTYKRLKQYQAMQEQMGQPSETQRKLAALEQENALLRRELTALQADVHAMLEADARRHKADDDRANVRVGIANLTINLFEAVHLMIRDLATVQAGIPQQSDAYRHPAAASMYKHLNDISTTLVHLRRAIQDDL